MKKYRFLTPALVEAEAASGFYEANRPDLGREFLDELDSTIQLIIANPNAWQVLEGDIRRCRLRRFPYGVIYTLGDDYILIISAMHLHRRRCIMRHDGMPSTDGLSSLPQSQSREKRSPSRQAKLSMPRL